MSDGVQVIADKYVVEKKLGEGGFGSVYLAHQQLVDRKVVVKSLHKELTENEEMRARFLREAQASSRVVHPNVVTIHDFGYAEDGSGYLVMEYVEGRPLDDVLGDEGRLEWRRAVLITRQVCAALAEAHAQGIVHRDIKPPNVMLTQPRGGGPEFVKVLDFGIAKLREVGSEKLTRTGSVMGTPSYMAPEQLEGKSVTGATDIYAVGVMLYRLVTGALPFDGPTMTSIIVKHLTDPPPHPRDTAPEAAIPPSLEAVILRCLEKLPDARQANMETLVAELDAVLAGPEDAPAASLASTQRGLPPEPAPGAAPSAAPAPAGARPAAWKWPVIVVALAALLGVGAAVALSGNGATPAGPGADADAAAVVGPASPADPKAAPGAGDVNSGQVPVAAPALELDPGPMNGLRLDGMPIEGLGAPKAP